MGEGEGEAEILGWENGGKGRLGRLEGSREGSWGGGHGVRTNKDKTSDR